MSDDAVYMELALDLARLRMGRTGENPSVGCVLVKEGAVIGSGVTSVGGRPKRWVVVRPSGAETSILIAKADGEVQRAAIGNQTAGRVGFFLTVDDFDARYEHMVASGVEFTSPPRTEPYGKVAVFVDIAGNKWDLLSRPHKSE